MPDIETRKRRSHKSVPTEASTLDHQNAEPMDGAQSLAKIAN